MNATKRKMPKTTMAYRSYKKIIGKPTTSAAIKKIVKKEIAKNEEVKTNEFIVAISDDVTFGFVTPCEGILKGALGGARVGDTIMLRGIRVEFSTENNAVTSAEPSEYEFYIIKTMQNSTTFVQANWFQAPENESSRAWSFFANGSQRIITRKNTSPETFEILHKHNFSLFSSANGVGSSAKSGVFYYRFKTPIEIRFRDNLGGGVSTTPAEIYPRIQVIFYNSRHRITTGHYGAAISMPMQVTTLAYFTDS